MMFTTRQTTVVYIYEIQILILQSSYNIIIKLVVRMHKKIKVVIYQSQMVYSTYDNIKEENPEP